MVSRDARLLLSDWDGLTYCSRSSEWTCPRVCAVSHCHKDRPALVGMLHLMYLRPGDKMLEARHSA